MSAAERERDAVRSSRSGSAPLVAAAGPFANFVLAIVLFTGLILHSGHTVLAPIIGDVVQGQRRRSGRHPAPATASPPSTAPPITDFEQIAGDHLGQRRPDPGHRPRARPASP